MLALFSFHQPMINTRTFDKTTEKREELYSVRDKNTYKGVMTGAGVTNFEFHNPAPEEGFCGIERPRTEGLFWAYQYFTVRLPPF